MVAESYHFSFSATYIPSKWVYNENLGYFWNLYTSSHLLVPKNYEKIEKCSHSNDKYQDICVQFGQNLVPFCFISQLTALKMGVQQKSRVVLESTHFVLSTGAKKTRKK